MSAGYTDLIELLVEKKVNVNACDDYKRTPLHYIARYDSWSRDSGTWTDDDTLNKLNFLEVLWEKSD